MKNQGFTLVEVMIVVAIIGILIAIAVPGFIRVREISRRNSCQENLTKIDDAKGTWALENNKISTDVPTWIDLVGENSTGYLRFQPFCPLDLFKDGRTYTINAVNDIPECDQGEGDFVHSFPLKIVNHGSDGDGS